MLDDLARAGSAFSDGKATQKDLDRMVTMVPAQNVFYIRHLLEQAKEATGMPEN
jgi:hypothetical protein